MVIAHLYRDLLNLYGNDGNTKIIKNKLEQMGYDVTVVAPSIGDDMDFDSYDLVFIGSGTEGNQQLAIKDIMRHRDAIERAIDGGTVFLAMGNALDLFGKGLVDHNSDVTNALGLLDFSSKWVNRIKQDVRRKSSFVDGDILGFENHNYVMVDKNEQVMENQEIIKNNFFGAYLEGPILVRNPDFLRRIIGILTEGNLDKLDLSLEDTAYDNFVKILDGGIN